LKPSASAVATGLSIEVRRYICTAYTSKKPSTLTDDGTYQQASAIAKNATTSSRKDYIKHDFRVTSSAAACSHAS